MRKISLNKILLGNDRRPDGFGGFFCREFLMQPKEKIMNSPDKSEDQQRQIKIDADIDEVIKTIQGLGLKPDEETSATANCDDPSRNCSRWMRLVVITITIFAIGALAGIICGYNWREPKPPFEIVVARRAIPVEPEIRRAIPVQVEIRKAIPLRTKHALRFTALCD